MKFRTPAELAIICTTGLIALTLVLFGLHNADANGKSIVFVVIALSIGAGLIALARPLTTRKKSAARTDRRGTIPRAGRGVPQAR